MKKLNKAIGALLIVASLVGCGSDGGGSSAPKPGTELYSSSAVASQAAKAANVIATKAAENAETTASTILSSFTDSKEVTKEITDQEAMVKDENFKATNALLIAMQAWKEAVRIKSEAESDNENPVFSADDATSNASNASDASDDATNVAAAKAAYDAAVVSANKAAAAYFNAYTHIRKVVARVAWTDVKVSVELVVAKVTAALAATEDVVTPANEAKAAYDIAMVAFDIVKKAYNEVTTLGIVPATGSPDDFDPTTLFDTAKNNVVAVENFYSNEYVDTKGATQLTAMALVEKDKAFAYATSVRVAGGVVRAKLLLAQEARTQAWNAYKSAFNTESLAQTAVVESIDGYLATATTQVGLAQVAMDNAEKAKKSLVGNNSVDAEATRFAYSNGVTPSKDNEESAGVLEYYNAIVTLRGNIATKVIALHLKVEIEGYKATAQVKVSITATAKTNATTAKTNADNSEVLFDISRFKEDAINEQTTAEAAKNAAASAWTSATTADPTNSTGLVNDIKDFSDNAKRDWEAIARIISAIADRYTIVNTPPYLATARVEEKVAEEKNASLIESGTIEAALIVAGAVDTAANNTKLAANSATIADADKREVNQLVVNAYTFAAHAWAKIAGMQKNIAKTASETAVEIKENVLLATDATIARALTDTKIDSNNVEVNIRHFKGMANNAKTGAETAKSMALVAWKATEGYTETGATRDAAKGYKDDAAKDYDDGTNASATTYSQTANAAYTVANTHTENLEVVQSKNTKENEQHAAQKNSKILRANWEYMGYAKSRRLTKLLFALFNHQKGSAANTFILKEGGEDCEYLDPHVKNNSNTQQVTEELSKDKDKAFTLTGGCGVLDVTLTHAQENVLKDLSTQSREGQSDADDYTLETLVGSLDNYGTNSSAQYFPMRIALVLSVQDNNDVNILTCSQQMFMLHSGWENSIEKPSDKNPLTYTCKVDSSITNSNDPVAITADGKVIVEGTGINKETKATP